MSDIKCWIAGFPRSGNHRLRQVVYSLLWRKPFEFGNVIEDGYRLVEDAGYRKTHAMGNLIEGKAIYTVRNEADVIKSVHRWFNGSKTPTIEIATQRVKSGNWEETELAKRWGSREQNINSFVNRPATLIVNYEDFGVQQVKDIAEFLGLAPLDEIVLWVDEEVVARKEKAYRETYGILPSRPMHVDKGEI